MSMGTWVKFNHGKAAALLGSEPMKMGHFNAERDPIPEAPALYLQNAGEDTTQYIKFRYKMLQIKTEHNIIRA